MLAENYHRLSFSCATSGEYGGSGFFDLIPPLVALIKAVPTQKRPLSHARAVKQLAIVDDIRKTDVCIITDRRPVFTFSEGRIEQVYREWTQFSFYERRLA